MRCDRDYLKEMTRLPLDSGTVDRLFAGKIAPDDAPPGLAPLAELVRAASAPGAPAELAAEASVVPAAALVISSPQPATRSVRTKYMLSKLRTAKVAVATTIGAFGLTVAAAAAMGALPSPTSHANSHASGGLATAAAHHGPSGSATTVATATTAAPTTSGVTTNSSVPPTGPANAQAQFGLCHAFLNGNSTAGGTPPPQDSSTAFTALTNEHGGIAATVTYCQGVVTTGSPSGAGSPAHTGKPSGVGKPAAAGNSASHKH